MGMKNCFISGKIVGQPSIVPVSGFTSVYVNIKTNEYGCMRFYKTLEEDHCSCAPISADSLFFKVSSAKDGDAVEIKVRKGYFSQPEPEILDFINLNQE